MEKQDINKIELAGTIGAVRIIKTGEMFAVSFPLATTERYFSRSGECCEETTWHNCRYMAKKDEDLSRFCRGARIHVAGKLRVSKYVGTECGERSFTEVIIQKIF